MIANAKKILIVDDDAEFTGFLADILSSYGYQYIEESNALSVIRTIKKEKPDLVTLDLKMPGADGIQIIKTIKRENIKVPIVVISGHIGKEELKKLVDLGITHLVMKPFKNKNLKKLLSKILT